MVENTLSVVSLVACRLSPRIIVSLRWAQVEARIYSAKQQKPTQSEQWANDCATKCACVYYRLSVCIGKSFNAMELLETLLFLNSLREHVSNAITITRSPHSRHGVVFAILSFVRSLSPDSEFHRSL